MKIPNELREVLVEVGVPADRIDRLVRICNSLEEFSLPELVITSTGCPQPLFLSDGRVYRRAGYHVTGGTWLLHCTDGRTRGLGIRIERIWVSLDAIQQEVAEAVLRLVTRDPAADLAFLEAKKHAWFAPLWISGRFIVTPDSNGGFRYAYRDNPELKSSMICPDFGLSHPPLTVRQLVTVHGPDILKDFRDPGRRRELNEFGDPDLALAMAIREWRLTRQGDRLVVITPDVPLVISRDEVVKLRGSASALAVICMIHGRRFVDRLWREAPVIG